MQHGYAGPRGDTSLKWDGAGRHEISPHCSEWCAIQSLLTVYICNFPSNSFCPQSTTGNCKKRNDQRQGDGYLIRLTLYIKFFFSALCFSHGIAVMWFPVHWAPCRRLLEWVFCSHHSVDEPKASFRGVLWLQIHWNTQDFCRIIISETRLICPSHYSLDIFFISIVISTNFFSHDPSGELYS